MRASFSLSASNGISRYLQIRFKALISYAHEEGAWFVLILWRHVEIHMILDTQGALIKQCLSLSCQQEVIAILLPDYYRGPEILLALSKL